MKTKNIKHIYVNSFIKKIVGNELYSGLTKITEEVRNSQTTVDRVLHAYDNSYIYLIERGPMCLEFIEQNVEARFEAYGNCIISGEHKDGLNSFLQEFFNKELGWRKDLSENTNEYEDVVLSKEQEDLFFESVYNFIYS